MLSSILMIYMIIWIIRFKKTWHVRQGIGSYGTCVAAQVTLVVPTWANGSHCHHQILGKTTTQMDLSKVSLLTLTDSEARLFDCFAIFFQFDGFALMMFFPWFSGYIHVPTPVKWKFRTTQASISIRWTIRIRSFGFVDYITINKQYTDHIHHNHIHTLHITRANYNSSTSSNFLN